MARPKKDESIRRTNNVMVRFTDVEYALVSCSAEQAGYPVAVYVRKQAITEKLHVHYNIVADIAELRDFARQLSHIGNNLNQIAAFFPCHAGRNQSLHDRSPRYAERNCRTGR